MRAQGAVRATEQAAARKDPAPARRASQPRLLDLHRTAGNAAVAALVRGAGPRAQAVLSGPGPVELGDALAATFGEHAREVPVAAEPAAALTAEGVTVDGRVQLAPGRFDTTSHEGQVRLGHEVAHALQQARGGTSPGGRLPVTPASRAALEAEAERAGYAFAAGRAFAVSGAAPAGTALFRGAVTQEPAGDQAPEPEAERELEAAVAQLDAKWAALDAALAAARKERLDWLRAHAEWREYEVPVDERLRRTPASLQPHELDVRLLQTALGSISREDAEYVLRRMGWASRSAEEASTQEQISNRAKIRYRTRGISLAVEYYNQLTEDRRRRWAYVDELLHTGPDMALEMFKDVGRGVWNGAVGFGQGLVDLPLAPLNLVRTIEGEEPAHLISLGGLRSGYHTLYGFHMGSSIELGTQLGLMAVTGKLGGGAAGGGAAATQTSRAAGLLSAWSKVNGLAAGGTAAVQAEQALRDIARGYVVENGKQRPLTEDDIIQRLAGIAFGAHAGYHAIGGLAARPGSTAGAEPPVPAVEPGAEPATAGAAPPPGPPAAPPAELQELQAPRKAPDAAGTITDAPPLELPGEVVVVEGSAPGRPATPGPNAPEADAALPAGVKSSKLRRRGMDLLSKMPESDRARITRALREMPPAQAGPLLTRIGRLDDVSAIEEALAVRREAAGAERPAKGPAQPTGGLDDSAPAYLDEDGDWQEFERRPPTRVSDTEEGVSRGALKGRMTRDGQAPAWARAAGDWNPHHLIPVSLENHPVLEELRANGGWDNNDSRNGIALPVRPGIPGAAGLPVHQVTPEVYRQSGRPLPDPQTMRDLQGHPVWNQRVRDRLDALKPLMDRPAELRIAVDNLISELRHDIETSVADGRPVLF